MPEAGRGSTAQARSQSQSVKDSALVEKNLSKTDVDIIFAKVCKPLGRSWPNALRSLAPGFRKGHRRIGLEQFDAALEMIADKKTLTLEEVWCAVRHAGPMLLRKGLGSQPSVACRRCCGGPVLNSTKAETVRFYDDKSLYTGTHAQGGPDPGRKGKGTLPRSQSSQQVPEALWGYVGLCGALWKSGFRLPRTWTTALRDEPSQGQASASTPVPNSPRDPEYSPPELEKRPRSVSLSEKKISQQLRGKDGTVEAGAELKISGP